MYTSLVTFLYYKDLEYGKYFFENILELKEVMDQGFAYVYQVRDNAFVGIVKTSELEDKNKTLVSLTTQDSELHYNRVKQLDVVNLTDLKTIESIPLKSFFFEDKEGHRFEIQEFLKEEDRKQF